MAGATDSNTELTWEQEAQTLRQQLGDQHPVSEWIDALLEHADDISPDEAALAEVLVSQVLSLPDAPLLLGFDEQEARNALVHAQDAAYQLVEVVRKADLACDKVRWREPHEVAAEVIVLTRDPTGVAARDEPLLWGPAGRPLEHTVTLPPAERRQLHSQSTGSTVEDVEERCQRDLEAVERHAVKRAAELRDGINSLTDEHDSAAAQVAASAADNGTGEADEDAMRALLVVSRDLCAGNRFLLAAERVAVACVHNDTDIDRYDTVAMVSFAESLSYRWLDAVNERSAVFEADGDVFSAAQLWGAAMTVEQVNRWAFIYGQQGIVAALTGRV